MSIMQSCIMLGIGISALIAGMLGKQHGSKHAGKSFSTGMLLLIIIGVVLITSSIIHVTLVDSHNEKSIQEVLDDDVNKTVQLFNNGVIYREYNDVITVEMANDNVVAFVTSDGLRHAIRPGTDAVIVTEVKDE